MHFQSPQAKKNRHGRLPQSQPLVKPTPTPLTRPSIPATNATLPIVLAFSSFVVTFLLLSLTYAPGIHPGSSSTSAKTQVDPFTCSIHTASIDGCWDGRTKWGYPLCTKGTGQTVLGQIIPSGTSTCYKTVYMNLEWTTFWLGLWTLGWFYGLCRTIENLFVNLWNQTLRISIFLTFLGNLFGMWYSFNSVFHYLNDHEGNFFRSQIYFTILEYATIFCLNLHFHRGRFLPVFLKWTQGSAMFQIFQLLLDEGQFFFSTKQQHSGRNFFLLLGDVTTLVTVTRMLVLRKYDALLEGANTLHIGAMTSNHQHYLQIVWYESKFGIICFGVELFLFHLVFSDNASVGPSAFWSTREST